MNKKELRAYYKKIGAKGGKATAKKHGSKYMHLLAKKAANARWSKRKRGDLSST